tara:strand:+ start:156 stop:389 length:234 start_codon:yes stop_codon:yes gene_type:complete
MLSSFKEIENKRIKNNISKNKLCIWAKISNTTYLRNIKKIHKANSDTLEKLDSALDELIIFEKNRKKVNGKNNGHKR